MKLSFSLAKPAKPVGTAPSLKHPSAFSSLDDDEDNGFSLEEESSNSKQNKNSNSKPVSQHAITSKAVQKRMEAEKKVDDSVYEYDEVWDKIQEAKQRAKEAKEIDVSQRKPKYIRGLLETAETRRLDHLRAEEALMQKEREREGDRFVDKESFVTQAYKDQMAEVRRAEEEERKREELQKKQKGFSSGMTHFYAKILQESSQTHEATVSATQRLTIGPSPESPLNNLTITKPTDYTPKSDADLARIARESGKEVELNDDNQLVDKRELLSAGLNLSAPNTRVLGRNTASASRSSSHTGLGGDEALAHRAAGTAASKREIDARRAREIKQQIVEEEERVQKEKEREEREATARVVAKRNNEEDIQNARERYLARKRLKLEEANASQDAPS